MKSQKKLVCGTRSARTVIGVTLAFDNVRDTFVDAATDYKSYA
jgi:hypothetical protein